MERSQVQRERSGSQPHLTQSFEQLPRASKITHAASLFRRRGLPGHAPGGQRAGGDHSTRARPFGGVYVVITKIAGSRTGGLIGLLHAYPLVAAYFRNRTAGEAISSAVSGVNYRLPVRHLI
jgi:hypothetical protein